MTLSVPAWLVVLGIIVIGFVVGCVVCFVFYLVGVSLMDQHDSSVFFFYGGPLLGLASAVTSWILMSMWWLP